MKSLQKRESVVSRTRMVYNGFRLRVAMVAAAAAAADPEAPISRPTMECIPIGYLDKCGKLWLNPKAGRKMLET